MRSCAPSPHMSPSPKPCSRRARSAWRTRRQRPLSSWRCLRGNCPAPACVPASAPLGCLSPTPIFRSVPGASRRPWKPLLTRAPHGVGFRDSRDRLLLCPSPASRPIVRRSKGSASLFRLSFTRAYATCVCRRLRGNEMRIGIVRELTPGESRVALTPYAVYELTRAGHRVFVETGAGEGGALWDEEYAEAGGRLVDDAAVVWRDSELIAKVFGPVPEEYDHLREGLILLAFLSLSVNRRLLGVLLESRCTAFSVETVRDERGTLPILTPMSEIAGSLVPQIGAHYLQRPAGGRGILLGGAAGVRPGRVVVLGAGAVGADAARLASGFGAEVVVVDRDLDRLRRLEEMRLGVVKTLAASSMGIHDVAVWAALLIGAVQ